MLVEKFLHSGKALVQTLSIKQWAADPFSQETLSESGEGLVDSPEEAPLLGVIGGVAVDFEALQRCAVDEHVRSSAEALKVLCKAKDVLQAVFLQVGNHGGKTDGDGLGEL